MGLIDPSLVIKVIYGASLRRITLDYDEKRDLDLNMDGLRARIISLFKLDTDVDLTLTYIDEDNDIITLVDEDDLYYALHQFLNPLRITAKLNSCCSSNYAPRVPQFQQHTMSYIEPWLTKFLESVLELLHDTQSNTSDIDVKVKQDLVTSKDTFSTPKVLLESDEFIVLENNQRGLENECTNKDVETLFPSNIDAPFNPNPMTPIYFDNTWGTDKKFPIIIPRIPSTTFMDYYWEKTNKLHRMFAGIPSIAGNDSTSQNGFSSEYTCPTIAENEMHGFDVESLCGNHVTKHCRENCHMDNNRGGIESHLSIQCDKSKACSIISPQLKLNYDHKQFQRSLDRLNQIDSGLKPYTRKLGGLLIQDKQVINGTFMKPTTSFTKIWRMRNNGTLVWPQELQLIWIGGYQFTGKTSVEIQVPGDGLHVDDELDITMDFTAPDHQGRYTSYWRMALPSGYRFGQVLTVDIQVVTSLKDPSTERFHQMMSNGSKRKNNENVDVQVRNLDDNKSSEILKQHLDDQSRNKQKVHSSSITKEVAGPGNFNITTRLAKQIVHDQQIHNQKLHSCSSTNVSKSFEQDKASKASKLNQSNKLFKAEEKWFKEFNTKNKKYNRKVSVWFEDLEELELKGFVDVDKVVYKFMDRQGRKKRSGKKTKYSWK